VYTAIGWGDERHGILDARISRPAFECSVCAEKVCVAMTFVATNYHIIYIDRISCALGSNTNMYAYYTPRGQLPHEWRKTRGTRAYIYMFVCVLCKGPRNLNIVMVSRSSRRENDYVAHFFAPAE